MINKCIQRLYRAIIFLILISSILHPSLSYGIEKTYTQALQYPKLVNQFYAANSQLWWVNTSQASEELRALLLQKIGNTAFMGTMPNRYHYNSLLEITANKIRKTDSMGLAKLDQLFTDAAITYCKDLYQGYGINTQLKYDELSPKCAAKDNSYIINQLASVHSQADLLNLFNKLIPNTQDYTAYMAELKNQQAANNNAKVKQLITTINFYRWIHHFQFEKYIVVTIPSATLKYYENDKEVLVSKVIVGKPKTKTPRFAAYCNEVILYPYWNVPRSIAINELLPRFKKSPQHIDALNMQLINAKGQVVNYHTLPWSRFSKHYFPYTIRQCTGCDNSLGVLKFNLTDPFSVYLHDTNVKKAFASNNRYLSHGCIRVEQAVELGNHLLNNKLDTPFLKACLKDEKPVTMRLEKIVPVFVVYLTASTNDSGTIKYYNNIYHL